MTRSRTLRPWVAMLALAACSCAVAVDWDQLRAGTASAYEAAVMADCGATPPTCPYAFFPLHDAPGSPTADNQGPEGMVATPMGGVTFTGSAASFDGTGYLDLGADYAFSGSGGLAPYTIEAWILPTQPSDSSDCMSDPMNCSQTILSEGTETGDGALTGYNVTLGPGSFGRGAGANSCGAGFMAPANGFHFVAIYDGKDSYVYINGAAAGMSTCGVGNNPALTQQCGTSLFVGCDPNMKNNFTGLMSELAIYQTALTPIQIANHYAAGGSGP